MKLVLTRIILGVATVLGTCNATTDFHRTFLVGGNANHGIHTRPKNNGNVDDAFLINSQKQSIMDSIHHPTNKLSSSSSSSDILLKLRGGGCNDSDLGLFAKIGFSTIVEAFALLGIILGTTELSEKIRIFPKIFGLSLTQRFGLFVVIFASSIVGSIVNGSISVATRQVLDPNVVPGDSDWYANLVKPSWNPPGWLFPIMWLIVSKPTQYFAVSRILKSANKVAEDVDMATQLPVPILFIYCAHLALGDAWNKVFFGYQCIGRGAAVITLFFGMLLTSAYLFGTIDETAGKLMLPTCYWVFVATALNWNIYLNN